MLKFLIGGSPCTHWSIAQTKGREVTASGIGWELFLNYLIAKQKFKPDFFLYENNKSAADAIKSQISRELGAPLQYINSALVSAQSRQRFYVHNLGGGGCVPQPEDRGILLRDIIESGFVDRNKSYTMCTNIGNTTSGIEMYKRSARQIVFEPVRVPIRVGTMPNKCGEVEDTQSARVYSTDGKSVALSANGGGGGAKTGLYAIPVEDTVVRTPIRVGTMPNSQGELVSTQTSRIYSIDGKSTTVAALNDGSFYALPLNTTADGKAKCLRASSHKDGIRNMIANNIDRRTCIAEPYNGQSKPWYEVKDGFVNVNGSYYDIKLPDGLYTIRKLTVTECCRLQTLPDDYCRAVSSTQAYKGLGNGWTAEVIIHLLSYALAGVPKDENILVLSMYDGIGTGRYCFDKMGYKNVTYIACEIDPYAIQVAMSNYPDIVQCGDAFQVREASTLDFM